MSSISDLLLDSSINFESLPLEERLTHALSFLAENSSFSQRAVAKHFHVSRSTLQSRLSGVKTRKEAHVMQMNLTPAQETVLEDWVKVMGRRGLPITAQTLRDHASDICGKDVGSSWPRRFMARHPDLKVRWTSSLEECRARSLNPTVVEEYFNTLKEVIAEYNIPPENIYNMDEKGIQLGIGKRVAALIDRNQKSVQHVESGNRELVTVIEAVSADGAALRPSVIFQGKRHNLEWSRNNPCKASVSISEKGWTDQELGTLWLERDFHPLSNARNKSKGYRLLILDGHNSHVTYRFCKFAAQHKIIIICLPSHTTHALQPCDVGIFGPLAVKWKAQVNKVARDYQFITKQNLLSHYAEARSEAFKESTIISAFAKTGIWPLNPNAIDPDAYAPAQNTTTQPAQPLPATLPSLLAPVPTSITESPSAASSVESSDSLPSSAAPSLPSSSPPLSTTSSSSTSSSSSDRAKRKYVLLGIPPVLPHTASRKALRDQNIHLRALLEAAQKQIEMDYAQKQLMDAENGRLRKRAFQREQAKPNRFHNGRSRHMTSEESLDRLAFTDWEVAMKIVHQEASDIFKKRRKAIDQFYKDLEAAEQAKRRQEKESERAEARRVKEAEQAAKKERLKQEMLERQARKEEEKAQKAAAKADAKAKKELEKAAQAAKKAAGKGARRGRGRSRKEVESDEGEFFDLTAVDAEDTESDTVPDSPVKPKPRPRPVYASKQSKAFRNTVQPNPTHPPAPTPTPTAPNVNNAASSQGVVGTVRRNPRRNVKSG